MPASRDVPGGAVFDLRDGFSGRVEPGAASPAFAECLTAISDSGGGSLYVPPGTWTIDETIVVATRGTTILGAGMRASRIRVAPRATIHGIQIEASDVSISRLTVMGNIATNSDREAGYHAISVRTDDADWIEIRDVAVEDAHAYGIGLQGGSFSQVVIENVSISNTGNDGIDFKNTENNGTRCFLRRIDVERHGQTSGAKAGIDLRGKVRLEGVEVREVGPGMAGVRFRDGDADSPNGIGAEHSTLDGYFVSKWHPAGIGIQGSPRGVVVGVGNTVEVPESS